MGQATPERDWKCIKRLRDELLDSLCKRINGQAAVILAEPGASEYKKYLKLFEHIQASDRIVAECFDDWRRSTLFMKIHALQCNGILEAKHIRLLSDETQQRLELMKGM